MVDAHTLIGGTPPPLVRPVSLAVKRYLKNTESDLIIVGVSGGADSLALATAVLAMSDRPEVWTVTVDHGLREGSDTEAQTVADLLEELGADRAVVSTPRVETGGEGAAREARFRAFNQIAKEAEQRAIDLLLGHTMDDQAETVLMRLSRGSSARSLAAMAPRRRHGSYWIGRPLLGVRRQDTVAFCETLNLRAVDDPTNYVDGPWQGGDGAPLRRAAIRERALPALSDALAMDVVPALARVAQQAREDEEALMSMVPSDLEGIEDLPVAVRKRALHQLAVKSGAHAGAITQVHIAQMDALISDWHGQGPVDLPGGVRAWREHGRIVVRKP